MKKIANYAAIVLVIAMVSCSSTKLSTTEFQKVISQSPPEGKSLVYVIRPSAFGGAVRFPVNCDERNLGSTMGGQFVYAVVEPGKHLLECVSENTSLLNIETEANKVYFVKQVPKMGWMQARNGMELLSENEGRELLKNVKLSGDCKEYVRGMKKGV